MFVQPTWFEGMMFYAILILIPIIIGVLITIIGGIKDNLPIFVIGIILCVVGLIMVPAASVMWHYQMEEPSVQEKIITVDDWQPTFGHYWGDVKKADDLMLKTTDGELFGNKENFLFGKFNTRDILNQLKPNGTYKIKYYGWREGFNDGVPNILSVEQVISENNTQKTHDISNYMNKRSIILEDSNDYR